MLSTRGGVQRASRPSGPLCALAVPAERATGGDTRLAPVGATLGRSSRAPAARSATVPAARVSARSRPGGAPLGPDGGLRPGRQPLAGRVNVAFALCSPVQGRAGARHDLGLQPHDPQHLPDQCSTAAAKWHARLTPAGKRRSLRLRERSGPKTLFSPVRHTSWQPGSP